jgi:hypothetical protein
MSKGSSEFFIIAKDEVTGLQRLAYMDAGPGREQDAEASLAMTASKY